MVVKNYKEMCKLLNEEEKNGASKRSQLKRWERYFCWTKDGHKFHIKEIYEQPLDVNDGRSNGNRKNHVGKNIKENPCFCINSEEIALNPGVYKIENDEYIYIGSTTRKLTQRFSEHFHNNDGNHEKTQQILLNGGKFTCLQSFEREANEKIIRECEAEYIRKYLNTDKVLLNSNLPETFSDENKTEYEILKIPTGLSDDVKKILYNAGYLIMKNALYNKKFFDDKKENIC